MLPSATTKLRVSLTKSRRPMNQEEALLRADSALVRSTLHPADPALLHLVMAGLQDFLVHLSHRASDLAASHHRHQEQWVPQVALLSRALLEWAPLHLDFKACLHFPRVHRPLPPMLCPPVVLPSLRPTLVGLVVLLHLILEVLLRLLVTRHPPQTVLCQQGVPLSLLGRQVLAECTLTGCE